LEDLLPNEVKPDGVLRNPPFSSSIGRTKNNDSNYAFQHVRSALIRLKTGGRLFALLGTDSVTKTDEARRSNWIRVIPMFAFSPEIRWAVYTTNTIESLNMTLRKIIKNRSLFPNDEAIFKLMYLSLKNISKKWTMPIHNWNAADESICHTF
jgi:hypothetical protein